MPSPSTSPAPLTAQPNPVAPPCPTNATSTAKSAPECTSTRPGPKASSGAAITKSPTPSWPMSPVDATAKPSQSCASPMGANRGAGVTIARMSRAFIKEPETTGPCCPSPPGCGGTGVTVSRVTLQARLGPAAAARFGDEAWFCPDPACAVAYFDARRERAMCGELLAPAWPKHAGAPLCACFGVSRQALEDFARRGDKAGMRAFLERAASAVAHCSTSAADGRSCATEARRVFLRELRAS